MENTLRYKAMAFDDRFFRCTSILVSSGCIMQLQWWSVFPVFLLYTHQAILLLIIPVLILMLLASCLIVLYHSYALMTKKIARLRHIHTI